MVAWSKLQAMLVNWSVHLDLVAYLTSVVVALICLALYKIKTRQTVDLEVSNVD